MDKHLLHQLVEKVLLFWVRPFGHYVLEIVHEGRQHLPVDGLFLQGADVAVFKRRGFAICDRWGTSEKIDLSAFWLTLFRLTPLTPLCYGFDPAGRRVELVDLSDGLRKEGFCLCGFKSSRDDWADCGSNGSLKSKGVFADKTW